MAKPRIRFRQDDGSVYPEWEEVTVGDVTVFHKQGYYTNEDYIHDGYKIARVSDLFCPLIVYDEMPRVPMTEKDYQAYKIETGDFLIARSGSIGRYGIVYDIPENSKVVFGSFIIKFLFDTNKISNEYFGQYYSSSFAEKSLKTITQTGANVNINAENIKGMKMLLPCLEEQQKIADFLVSLDEVIVSSEAEVQNLETQKKIVMKKIFSQEVRFKREDGTDFPEWREDSLSNLCEYVDYRGKTPEKVNSGIFLITAKNIRMGYIDYDVSQEFVSDDDYDNIMHRGKPAIGDVLFTTEAPCGMVAQVDREDIALAQRVIKYRTADKKVLLNDYLKYVLMSHVFQNDLEKKATGGTVKGIKGAVLHEMLIILPCVEEQYLISDFLAGFDEAIAAAKKELELWKELKKGLLQQMFV